MSSRLVIDISDNNAEPDWARLALVPIAGVICKLSEGLTERDPFGPGWAKRARGVGLRAGFYHYGHASNAPVTEAGHFLRMIELAGGIKRRDYRPALDLEVTDGQGMKAVNTWAREWCRAVRRGCGVCPMYYTYSAFAQWQRLSSTIGCALWLAAYDRDDGQEHAYAVPAPWKHVDLHQFTSRGAIPGCRGLVDVSYAHRPRALLAHPILGLR